MDVDWAALGLLPPFEEQRTLPPAAFTEQFGSDHHGYDFARLADPTSWELSSCYHWPPHSPFDSSSSEAGSSSASSYGGQGDFPVPSMLEVDGCDGIDPLLLFGGSSPASEPLFDSPVTQRSGHRLSFGSSVGEEYIDDLRDGDWLPQSPLRLSCSSRGQDLSMQFLMDGMDGMDLPESSQMTIKGSDMLKASRALRPPALIVSSSATLSDTSFATRPTKYPRTDSTPFQELPTKKPRGRRPVDEAELGLDLSMGVHDNASPTEEQIAFAGRTKTGKIKKVFLCQVPGCGRCFRRSEHLRRHIRSLHSNEKPYSCSVCEKSFSRSDNLVQHKRGVHGLTI